MEVQPTSKSILPASENLDALLVYIQASSFAWTFSRQMQTGLYFLAQHASDAGYRVRVDGLSANDHVVNRLSRILKERSCDILGFYVDHDNQWDLRRILPSLKKNIPQLKIVLGGPQVTVEPEVTMQRLPECTCGVIGEGEETFVELLGLPSMDVAQLVTCNGIAINADAGVIRTPSRPPIENLDRLSIPRRKELSLDQDSAFHPLMITGRGCPGRCAYCFEGRNPQSGKRLRLHSAQRCLDEFDRLVIDFGRKYVCILDNTFVAHPGRLRQFCDGLIEKYNGQKKWFCEARVDTLAQHPDLLPRMIEAGLVRLQLGGESGCQRILNLYNKGTTLEQMVTVAESAKTNGLLSAYVNFIVGGADETQQTFEQTKQFALSLLDLAPGCFSVGHSFYTPYPGTEMYCHPDVFGIEVMDRDVVTGMGDHHVFCRTKELSRFEILALGQDFKQSVQSKMRFLCKQLPASLIEQHFRAFYEWELSTEWHEALASDGAIYGYFKSVYNAGAKTFTQAAEEDFLHAYPLRNVELVATKGDNFLVRLHDGSICEMDDLETTILELSAGKLCFEEIVEVLCERLPSLDITAVRNAVIERYRDFDKNFLIVWKTDL